MRLPRLWRRWVAVVAVVLVLAVAAVHSLDSPSWIYYYRVVDEHTLVVGTVTGRNAWTRVASVVETPTTVTITVSSLSIQLGPGSTVGIPVESTVKLRDPIASRTVIDGSSGLSVQRTHCLPPVYFAPGCTPSPAAARSRSKRLRHGARGLERRPRIRRATPPLGSNHGSRTWHPDPGRSRNRRPSRCGHAPEGSSRAVQESGRPLPRRDVGRRDGRLVPDRRGRRDRCATS